MLELSYLNDLMPRKRVTYTIDERIIDVISKMADKEGISRNRFLEKHFAHLGVLGGFLSTDFKMLGETRGGDRRKKNLEAGDND